MERRRSTRRVSLFFLRDFEMAHQWYQFGVGAPPILVYFSEDLDVRWGYGLLTHRVEGVTLAVCGVLLVSAGVWLCAMAGSGHLL